MIKDIKEIPVPEHVKQYLVGEFGPEPLPIHACSFLGAVIGLVAEKCPYRVNAPKLRTEGMTTVKIKMPKSLRHQTITPESLKGLGQFFEKFFKQQFLLYMKGQVQITQNEHHAVRTFYENYNINPDSLDLDALRKTWRDYKDKLVKHNGRLAA